MGDCLEDAATSDAKRREREKYFAEGPQCYSKYAGLHNTATASHPTIVVPGEGGTALGLLRYQVEALDADFESGEPSVMEDELYFFVVLPAFKATASVSVGETFVTDGTWQFGWITAVSDWRAEILYHKPPADGTPVDAVARWELPYVHVPTSDGECPPWHSRTARSQPLSTPGRARRVSVPLECQLDRVLPKVPWRVLVPGGYRHAHKYTVRAEYYAWLALKNLSNGTIRVLRTVVWQRQVTVNFDRSKPFGRRARIVSAVDKVVDTNRNHPIPEWALGRPYAHEEMTLKLRCVDEDHVNPGVVVIFGPNNRYVDLPPMSAD